MYFIVRGRAGVVKHNNCGLNGMDSKSIGLVPTQVRDLPSALSFSQNIFKHT